MFWKIVLIILLIIGIITNTKAVFKKTIDYDFKFSEKEIKESMGLIKGTIIFTVLVVSLILALIAIWGATVVGTNIAIIGCIVFTLYLIYGCTKDYKTLIKLIEETKTGKVSIKRTFKNIMTTLLTVIYLIYLEYMLVLSVL